MDIKPARMTTRAAAHAINTALRKRNSGLRVTVVTTGLLNIPNANSYDFDMVVERLADVCAGLGLTGVVVRLHNRLCPALALFEVPLSKRKKTKGAK